MEPQEIADAVEQIATFAVELAKQIATPVYTAAFAKVVATNTVWLAAFGVILVMWLGVTGLCIIQRNRYYRMAETELEYRMKEGGSRRYSDAYRDFNDSGHTWSVTAVVFGVFSILPLIGCGSCLATLLSAEYWALLLMRDILMLR